MGNDPEPYSAMALNFGSKNAILDLTTGKLTGNTLSLTGLVMAGKDAKTVAGFRPGDWFRIDVYRAVGGMDAVTLRTAGTADLLSSCFHSEVAFTDATTPAVLDLLTSGDPSNDKCRVVTEITVPEGCEAEYWEQLMKGITNALNEANKMGPHVLLALQRPGTLIMLQSWPTTTQHSWFERVVLGTVLRHELNLLDDNYVRSLLSKSHFNTD